MVVNHLDEDETEIVCVVNIRLGDYVTTEENKIQKVSKRTC